MLTPEQIERFWGRVDKSGECWLWTGRRDGYGYGVYYSRAHIQQMHRVAYTLTYGPIPQGLCVLHRCDNPTCVRPDHLFLGTRADNARDRAAKGRGRRLKPRPEGEIIHQKLRQVGSTYVVTIPWEEVERLNLQEGQLLAVEIHPVELYPALTPELREAFEASWVRSEVAYRYLAER